MKIHLEDITDNGLTVDLSEEGKTLEEAAGGLDFSFAAPVKSHMDFTRADGNVIVRGDIKTKIKLNCSRCLNEFEYPFETDFTAYFEKVRDGEKEKELKASELDVNYYVEPVLDTTEILLGQIAVELPMQPLCKEDCKGLCPTCGADLNLGDCGCASKDKTNPKFAKLKDFKVK